MNVVIGLVLGAVLLLVLGVLIGWCAMEVRTEDQQEDIKRQKSQVNREMNAIRTANRLGLAFWRTKEELDTEARRHQRGGEWW
ncbi:hypothetical protein [Amycolatopsis sp. NPDC051128]|uniref:hypothetical protein n=1 Tax=Amycolatopsis sp. NPDC051128 TaxID=3155412 RepID=UPI003413F71D